MIDKPIEQSEPSIAVLVVLFKSSESLHRLIQSLATYGDQFDEVLFCDNSPDARDEDLVDQLCVRYKIQYRYKWEPTNPGFAASCNTLSNLTDADLLVFLNPDTELVQFPERHEWPQGITGAMLETESGESHKAYGQTRRVMDELRFRLLRKSPPRPEGFGYVSGAALAIRSSDFRLLQGFDERFFMYYEDIDLCLRAGEMQIPVGIHPRWVVVHLGGLSAKKSSANAEIVSLRSGIAFYKKRHQNERRYIALIVADSALKVAILRGSRYRPRRNSYRQLLSTAARELLRRQN